MLDGRAVHAYHVEGCGGGHTPNVLRLAGVDHVLASSTNPTLPFGLDALAEHVSMIMVSTACTPTSPVTWTWPATGCAPRRWAPRTCSTTTA